jgi:hypothetical protein
MAFEDTLIVGRAITEIGDPPKLRPKAYPQPGDKRFGRSSVGNTLLPGTDGRNMWARRYRDLVAAITSDSDQCRLSLIRRFAGATCFAELLEAKLAAGEEVSIQTHAMLSSALVQLSNKIDDDDRKIGRPK